LGVKIVGDTRPRPRMRRRRSNRLRRRSGSTSTAWLPPGRTRGCSGC
jgi:hypothetical protein